jgi:hypothetical protein
MIVFEARTLEELIVEVREKEIEIGVESVISTLIGLETGVEVVKLDIQITEELKEEFDFTLEVYTEEYQSTFQKNKDKLIEAEEYELLTEVQKHIG